jgi:ribosomal protein S18 acetylase RimI-like enzyme
MITFSTMRPDEDRQTILAFYRATALDSTGTHLEFDEDGYLNGIRERSARYPEGYVLVLSDEQPIGHMELQVKHHEGRDVGYVSLIYLHPDHRGRGVSQEMFAYAETFFRKQQVAEYHLRVDVGNRRALRFYEKQGMQTLCAEPNSLGDPCYRLGKKL